VYWLIARPLAALLPNLLILGNNASLTFPFEVGAKIQFTFHGTSGVTRRYLALSLCFNLGAELFQPTAIRPVPPCCLVSMC
jgi:hypothetical protein